MPTTAAQKVEFVVSGPTTYTYANTTEGVLDFTFDPQVTSKAVHTGGSFHPVVNPAVTSQPIIRVDIADSLLTSEPDIDDEGTLTVTYLEDDRTTTDEVFYRFRYKGKSVSQPQHTEGITTLNFEYAAGSDDKDPFTS